MCYLPRYLGIKDNRTKRSFNILSNFVGTDIVSLLNYNFVTDYINCLINRVIPAVHVHNINKDKITIQMLNTAAGV